MEAIGFRNVDKLATHPADSRAVLHLRLTKFELANFRSYRELGRVSFDAPITVLIGPNNAGKSNVLQALVWYRDTSLGRPPRSPKELVHTANKGGPTKLELEFELGEEERALLTSALEFKSQEIRMSFEKSEFLKRAKHEIELTVSGLQNEVVSVSNWSGEWLGVFGRFLETQTSSFWRYGEKLRQRIRQLDEARDIPTPDKGGVQREGGVLYPFSWPLEERTFENTFAVMLKNFIARWQYIPPVRQANPRINPAQETLVYPDGTNLFRVLNWMQNEDPEGFVSLANEIYRIIPGLSRLIAPLRGNEATAVIKETGNVEVEARDISTGLQQTLILVTSILTHPENSLLMMEEPEIHLHAASQRALLRLMTRLAKEREHAFILATHSTIFARLNQDVSTFLVTKHDGGSAIKELRETPQLTEIRQVMGVENTDLFGFNAALIVEGDTEATSLPIIAEGLGLDFASLGMKIVNIRGAGKLNQIEELLRFLKDSNTVPFVMLDNDQHAKSKVNDWIRDGLLLSENTFFWPMNFEDCFDNDTIFAATNAYASTAGFSLSLKPDDISKPRAAGESVSNVLGRLIFTRAGKPLSKPILGREIARALIARVPNQVGQTLPGQALSRIAQVLTDSSERVA